MSPVTWLVESAKPDEPTTSVLEIRAKFGRPSRLHISRPLANLTELSIPELGAFRKVFEHDILLTFLQQVFGESHVWTEGI